MFDRRTILILTSKTGGGHVSLAEALRDLLAQDYNIEIVDPQARFFHWHYRIVSRYALWLWSAEFQFTDTSQRALFAHRVFTRLTARSLSQVLKRVQPDLIITTYPFLTYEVTQLLRSNGMSIPFVILFTDPNNIHATWLTERQADATLAPTRETYEQARAADFAPECLHAVGWPVREQFYQARSLSRTEMLTKLALDPAGFTVFLQGGGEGAAQFSQTVERILAIDPNLQVILATGTNRALLTRFNAVKNLYALPFTKEIAPFMVASDVIMGKAGPNMLFEAVTLGKPFIATAYIPGQEEENLEFIQRHQLGWVALTAAQQTALLTQLVTDQTELHVMSASVDAYCQWNASATAAIAPVIEGLLKREHEKT